jgi:broad specificity phosphatase PhoE
MNNKYMLMRHGETKYQAEGKDYYLYSREEQMDLSITEDAKKVIENRATELKEKNIDVIYCSDYLRTRQTAEIVSRVINAEVVLDKRLRDINFGIFSGGNSRDFSEYFSSRIKRFSERPLEGESWGDVRKRLIEALNEIEEKNKDKTILIVTHGDPFWLLIGIIKNLTDEELLNYDFYPKPGQYLDLLAL